MKANDLKTGNFLFRHGFEVEIDSIQKELLAVKGEQFYNPIKFFEPISLNIDYLIRFGFKKGLNEGIDIYYLPFFSEWEIYQAGSGSFIFYHEHLDPRIWCKNIDYVHQLQNIYALLIGTELNCA